MEKESERTRLSIGLRLIKAIDDYHTNQQELIHDASRVMDAYARHLQPLNELPELCSANTDFVKRYNAFRLYLRDVTRAMLQQIADSLERHIRQGTEFSQDAEKNLETAVNYLGKCLQSTYKYADAPLLAALHVVQLHCFLLFACTFLEPFLITIADTNAQENVRLLDALHIFGIARLRHDEFQSLDVDDALPVIFASALGQLAWQPKRNESAPLVREARVVINPSSTGRHRKREHEKQDTSYRRHEDDRTPLEKENKPQHEKLTWLQPKRYDPEEIMEREGLLRQIFANLTEEEEAILRMYADGYTDAEVATLLGTTAEGVKKRRQRLINRLRQNLAS